MPWGNWRSADPAFQRGAIVPAQGDTQKLMSCRNIVILATPAPKYPSHSSPRCYISDVVRPVQQPIARRLAQKLFLGFADSYSLFAIQLSANFTSESHQFGKSNVSALFIGNLCSSIEIEIPSSVRSTYRSQPS